jgi:hypothetical protein
LNLAQSIKEGHIIQFFEQAFDWNNMTYHFYPYLYANKDRWETLMMQNDKDPKFTDFLSAGAARVVLPVQQVFDRTVMHYLETNQIWHGRDPNDITLDDELYQSITDEIKADGDPDDFKSMCVCSSQDPGTDEAAGEDQTCKAIEKKEIINDYPCIVDTWEYTIPTTLIYLKSSENPDPLKIDKELPEDKDFIKKLKHHLGKNKVGFFDQCDCDQLVPTTQASSSSSGGNPVRNIGV